MTDKTRAPREVERMMLSRVNAEMARRGATEILSIEMSQEVRGEHFVLVVTPNIGDPFEVLLPYAVAFPGLLESAIPPDAARH